MNKIRQVKAILRSINRHPLAGRHRLKAYYKFFQWQIGRIIDTREKKVAFTDRSFLLVKKGMEGATGNIYMGLHEFAEMGFLLHFLRKDDLFFDIGANIGSYMVLASAHVAARTFAFEPVPSTFSTLEKNILINEISALVNAFNIGVGSKQDKLIFTSAFGSVNHVVPVHETHPSENIIEVNMMSVDEIVNKNEAPLMIKIDVEGFETEVVKGMNSTLQNEKLRAIIIELNGSGGRYGHDENDIHLAFLDAGFKPFEYDPYSRKLHALETYGHFNTLYLRDIKFVEERLATAENVSIYSEKF